MARYFSPSNLDYKPFTLDELTKPLDLYKSAYDSIEQKYNSLVLDSQNYDSVLNEKAEPNSYSMMQQYNQDLDAAYGNFINNGNIKYANSDILKIRHSYNENMKPVKNAFLARENDRKIAQNYQNKGYIISRNPFNESLDSYLSENKDVIDGIDPYKIMDVAKKTTSSYAGTIVRQAKKDGMLHTIVGLGEDEFSNWIDGLKSGIDKNPQLTRIYIDMLKINPKFANNDEYRNCILVGMSQGLSYKESSQNLPKPKTEKAKSTIAQPHNTAL